MKIVWKWITFDELTVAELYTAMVLRQQVFVVEQNCAYLDADGHDIGAWHLLGWTGDDLIAYARVLAPSTKHMEPAIGRVAVSPNHRGKGLGRELMNEAIRRTGLAFSRNPDPRGSTGVPQSFLYRTRL